MGKLNPKKLVAFIPENGQRQKVCVYLVVLGINFQQRSEREPVPGLFLLFILEPLSSVVGWRALAVN